MKNHLGPHGTSGPGTLLGTLWKQRSLVWQFTVRTVELRHKGSHLGLLWSIANPLLILSLYLFVFGYVFGGSFGVIPNETRADYGLGLLLGLSLFHFIAEVLGQAPMVIVSNPNFVKKVVFPLEILPISTVAASFFHFLISMALAIIGIALFGPGLGPRVLWLPVIFVPVFLWGLGLAWVLSALGVFFRDINQVIQFLSMALLYASAIFYSASKIDGLAWEILRFNPLIHAVEIFRDAALWDQPISMKALGYLYATSIVACGSSYYIFRKLRPAFADVV